MKKKQHPNVFWEKCAYSKITRVMKLTIAIMIFACLHVSAGGFSQEKVSLDLQSVSLKKVLSTIEKKSSFRFLYNETVVANTPAVSIVAANEDVKSVLHKIFANTHIDYKILDNNLIVLKEGSGAEVAADVPAPNIRVTGTVTSSQGGSPLLGVSVQVKGKATGTATDVNGNFSLNNVLETDVLVFSSVGFETLEVPVAGKVVLNVVLQPSNRELDQVVVVGYGTARRRDLTGAVASIKGADLASQPVLTATQALQGKAAGVQIISSGAPNSNPAVRIRGTGSMLAGANPLYVVDGVITDDITNINNADIVTMDVLKDASSTAIYGVRAANGVIIITTKKGRSGKMQISYDGTVGVKEAAHLVNMAGSKQYTGYINEASRYYGSTDDLVDTTLLKNGYNTDWYDAILRQALQQNNNLSISGGSDKINYFLSAGYLIDNGIVKNNNFKRFTLRSNNEYKISNKLRLTTLISFSNGVLDDVDLSSASGNAYRATPLIPPMVNGKYGNTSAFQNVGNPVLDIDKNYNRGNDSRFQGAATLEYKITKWLTFNSNLGVDLDFYKNTQYKYQYNADSTIFIQTGGNQEQAVSTLAMTKNDANRWIWDNTLTAAKKFGDHNFRLMVGTTAEKFNFNRLYGYRQGVPAQQSQWYLNTGLDSTQKNNGSGDKWSRNSYIGRLNYDYKDKYLITATLRADGSSRFPSYNRWGYFPSVGVGWNISSEDFMKDQKTFDYLKLRASWGKVGNDNIPSAAFLDLATSNLQYGYLGNGIAFTNVVDPNLKWEETEEIDLGVDFSVLDKRLTGTIDLYHKKVNDALINIVPNGALGDQDNKILTNAASILNKGIELGLNWADKAGKEWSYNINANVAFNHNEVAGLSGGQALSDGDIAGQGFVTLSPSGQPIASYNVLQVMGVFQSQAEIDGYKNKDGKVIQPNAVPGDFKYQDTNGDGTISAADRVLVGSYQPKIIYGINGGVTYKSFDLSIGTYGTSGGKIYNAKKALRDNANQLENMESDVVTNRWTVTNKTNAEPRASITQMPASTYFVENGSFFRINNLTIGYTLPAKSLEQAKITKLRVYVAAQNLATFTKYKGFTPEFSSVTAQASSLKGDPLSATNQSNLGITNAGVDVNTYPTIRTWVFGLNLGF
ncbi:TonB-dependent receptor [Pinibacter soli]|uniref:TonB-dependent receptor n=1 Tax=Pinibacter soli TaxID=3044211 RepID=A0ABT6R8K9_9BACT|nr:TonB-dependent receptor [Pinibacter soli]MDI3318750.1 TonB-dependent receptor [Pinibacter soli]